MLFCVLHLEKGDKSKLLQLNPKKGAIQRILADIYGCHYGAIKEYGLADSIEKDDFEVRLEWLRSIRETFALVFTNGFPINENISFSLASLKVQENRLMCKVCSNNNNIE